MKVPRHMLETQHQDETCTNAKIDLGPLEPASLITSPPSAARPRAANYIISSFGIDPAKPANKNTTNLLEGPGLLQRGSGVSYIYIYTRVYKYNYTYMFFLHT